MNRQVKTRIGITMGDLGGVGPEIFYKLEKNLGLETEDFSLMLIDEKKSLDNLSDQITLGKPSAYSGEHAYQTILRAHSLLQNREIDHVITGPVAKESLWLAGIQVSGQTELFAQINNLSREDIEMFFVLDEFRVVLATRHVPIKEVPAIFETRFKKVICNSVQALDKIFGISQPKIAVAGLNPHAGENGIIGLEEKIFLAPAIAEFKNQGVNIQGPLAPDSLLALAAQNYLKGKPQDYDLYVAAYHDQVLPVIKGVGGLRAINLTAGLPYIRLSVDHGTGFDIAGKNLASEEGLYSCLDFLRIGLQSSGLPHSRHPGVQNFRHPGV